ncbi:PIG-L family deacetylase [Arachnia propionica]|uniref:GlcNAc-PI de-N-acetylase n=1 Tax=Arachnia propionica TaxID=1750 RepID=A0A3P1WYN4_9ACTN|nr:PIG-L family deacetylase [Arachnia propionica]RRD50787.1 GlcNAc-PI de-N-acetylase [Arachnia propionica]
MSKSLRIAFVHAHPDDESLWSGALTAHLVAAGHEVSLLTATRGERGDVVPGELSSLAGTPELERHRIGELARAVASLGFARHAFLGDPPVGSGRRYRDSGMTWLRPGLAGPAADAEPDSLCSRPLDDVVADLAAWLRHVDADLVVSYDDDGGYGHPDHVRMHRACVAAARLLGVGFAAVVHAPGEGVRWFDLDNLAPRVEEALRHHASQLTVNGDGTLTHSGGQTEPVVTSVGLRPDAVARPVVEGL